MRGFLFQLTYVSKSELGFSAVAFSESISFGQGDSPSDSLNCSSDGCRAK